VLYAAAAEAEVQEMPVGMRQTTSNVLETFTGFIHPSLELSENYNDNVFASYSQRKGDLDTIVSPSIWISLPGLAEQLYTISTSYVTPGGLPLTRFVSAGDRAFQAYIYGRGDFERYIRNSDENSDNYKFEGMFQYNSPGGLLANVTEQNMKYHTIAGIGSVTAINKYETNSFNTLLSYELSDSFAVRADYSNYTINYDEAANVFQNRTDNTVSGYVFYKIAARTELFGEYDFANVHYDKNILQDSQDERGFLGFRKEVTAKTMIMVKLGYEVKDYEHSNINKSGNVSVESQIQHTFTPKSSIGFIL